MYSKQKVKSLQKNVNYQHFVLATGPLNLRVVEMINGGQNA